MGHEAEEGFVFLVFVKGCVGLRGDACEKIAKVWQKIVKESDVSLRRKEVLG